MQYDMLRKSELKITHIHLREANLSCIAKCVAMLYDVPQDKVMVIDVRNEEVALDILDDSIDPHSFIAKEGKLLSELRKIPGVTLDEGARISSDGMLGWIAFDATQDEIDESLRRSAEMAGAVTDAVRNRVIVFPSGTEVRRGEIEDTNTPMLIRALKENGYTAEAGPILEDDLDAIVGKILWAIGKAFGTIITTGGVGAEDKDHSVEAVLALDADASTPYVAHFNKGHGRHIKDGIRIAVGKVDGVRIVTLPGPNDEVSLCIPVLLEGMQKDLPNKILAESLAHVLRQRWKDKCSHCNSGD